MSKISEYYESNKAVNPYTMESNKGSSRVNILIEILTTVLRPGAKVLDVGCGDMYLSKALPQYDWTGIDISVESNQGKAIKHDLEDTPYPFPDGVFSAVVCSEVLEHVFDPVKVTKEIYRVLKDTGTYLLSTPNHDFVDHYITNFRELVFDPTKSWTKEHIHTYTLESHAKILEEAGFKQYSFLGADPHFGEFFKEARHILYTYLLMIAKVPEEQAQVDTDVLLGKMFRKHSHTIILEVNK